MPSGHTLGRLAADVELTAPMAPEQLVALHAVLVRAVGIPSRIVVGYAIGDEEEIHSFLREGLWLPIARAEGEVEEGEQVTHSPKIVAVDKKGQTRGWYDGTDPLEVQKLRERMLHLAAEE